MSRQTKYLLEAASLVGESAREDGAWKVRLISEGQGSSGFYSRDLLEGYHEVFNDVLSFSNHPTGWDGPEARDFTMIVGEILGETWVEDDERGMAAITGWYMPDPEHKDKIERYKNKLGVSIYAMGEGEFDENTGNFRVTSFQEDPYNSLDVVIAAGARGKFLESMRKTYEHRSSEHKPGAASAQEIKESKGMTMDEETKAAFAALTTLISGLVETKQESAKVEVEASVVSEAVKSGVEAFAERSKLVAEADILESQKAALLDRAAHGEDITAGLAEAVKFAAEAKETYSKESYQESGRIGESAATEGYVLTGFGGSK